MSMLKLNCTYPGKKHMLTPQLCTLVLLSVFSKTVQSTGLNSANATGSTRVAESKSLHNELLLTVSQPPDKVNASKIRDESSTTATLCQSQTLSDADIEVDAVNAAILQLPRLQSLLEVQNPVSEDDVEAGARELIQKTGAYSGGPDLVGAEKMFGFVSIDFCNDITCRLTNSSLPPSIAANLAALFNAHRKLDANFISRYMQAIGNWYRSMRVASNAIKGKMIAKVITRHTRAALDELLESTNGVMKVIVESMYVRRAIRIYHIENADKITALLDDEQNKFEERLRRYTESRQTGKFSIAVAVAHAYCMICTVNTAIIEADLQLLTNEAKIVNVSMTDKLDDHIAYYRDVLAKYRWISDAEVVADPETFDIAGNRLFALSNEVQKKLTTIRAKTIRKIEVEEQKKALNVYKSIIFERAEYAHKLLHSMRSTISHDVFVRTEAFVTEFLSSGIISRALDDEECEIVSAVDKITGRKHRKTKLAVSSAPETVCWDEIRKGQCVERLDAAIVSEQVNVDLNTDLIDQATAELGHTVAQFKRLLLERVELMTTMRNSIHILDDRKTINATGKRYKAVKLEIDAVRDSLEKMIKAVKELVSRKLESKAIVLSSDAAMTVLDHLRAEIAKAETLEAVNRAIATVAEETNQKENSLKFQAGAEAKIITRITMNANAAKLAWLDAFSRILTHTNRLESILDTAFKANRVLDAGELRQTDIRLAKMIEITAEILANVDIEQKELVEMRKAETIHAEANARAAAFAKLSTQSRLKAIIFDGASQ